MKLPFASICIVLGIVSGLGCHRAEQAPEGHSTPTTAESATANPKEEVPERYRDIPIRAVLESYVLSTVGELSIERERATSTFVRRTMGKNEQNWRTTVRRQLGWKDEVDALILTNWKRFREANAGRVHVDASPESFDGGVAPESEEFARIFVDEIILKAPARAASSAQEAGMPAPGEPTPRVVLGDAATH